MAEQIIKPPTERHSEHVTLHDDRVGMTAEELIDRGLEAFKELDKEVEILMRNLPRKYEKRFRKTSTNSSIVSECMRGAKARISIVRRAMGTPKGTQ